MFNRAFCKDKAKAELRQSYWLSLLVAFLGALLGGQNSSGFTFGSSSSSSNSYSSAGRYSFTDYDVNTLKEYFNSPEWQEILAIAGFIIAIVVFILIVAACYKIFVGNPIYVGLRTFFIRAPYGEHKIETLFSSFKKGRYGKITKTMFVKDLYLFLWGLPSFAALLAGTIGCIYIIASSTGYVDDVGIRLFAVFIPATLVSIALSFIVTVKNYSYRLVPYIISECPHLSANEAITLSRKMMNGNKWAMFVFDLSFIGWYLLGFIACGIGILFVHPYYYAAEAQVYFEIRQRSFENGSLNETLQGRPMDYGILGQPTPPYVPEPSQIYYVQNPPQQ
ncbi:MAG: DUF975 family protein [Oscillospiraceae bacterium]|jgi:uncharacterized membrane protein|nr:DUF975 family protein [Oscillospiraceae bacterium]